MEPYRCVRFQTCELFSYMVSSLWFQSVNISLSIGFNICFGCSKEPSHRDGSSEYTRYVIWLKNKNLFLVSHSYLKPWISYKMRKSESIVLELSSVVKSFAKKVLNKKVYRMGACVRVCVRAFVCVCVCERERERERETKERTSPTKIWYS